MKHDVHLTAEPWTDYELIDSGENEKLERFGDIVLARPETQALWARQRPEVWESAHARFAFADKHGAWDTRRAVPTKWRVARGEMRLIARLTNFKHTGIFPEQAPNWDWLQGRTGTILQRLGTGSEGAKNSSRSPAVLNLFGYTGAASIAAAQAGASVTHVDASKQSLDWANENATASGLEGENIRWILDDALAFAKREVRRGAHYDGIILDPPAFGRGAKGEVWHIDEDLPKLLATLAELLSPEPGSFLLMSGYAAGYSARAFAQALESAFDLANVSEAASGELLIQESASGRVVPAGIYARFVR